MLGPEHSSTLNAMHGLALTYRDKDRLDDAEELFVLVVEGRKRVLGPRHSYTLNAIHELALTCLDKGRLDDAEELFDLVVEARSS